MMKRLKDNAMLIILCIVMICCTVSVNKRLDEVNGELGSINYKMNDLPNYNQVREINENTYHIRNDVTEISTDIEYIRQDVDDIGYHFGI